MQGITIAVAQQKGGAGKTTLAAHLAVACSQFGLDVAAIDIDPQGSLTHWHSVREKQNDASLTPMDFTSISGWRVGKEISKFAESHDIVIIDSPPHTQTEAREAIRHADLVVIPMQPSPLDLWATQATIKMAKEEKKPIKMVLNRVNSMSKLSQTIAEDIPAMCQNRFGNRVSYAGAMVSGRGVTETAPSSIASKEVLALAEEILAYFGIEVVDEEDYQEFA